MLIKLLSLGVTNCTNFCMLGYQPIFVLTNIEQFPEFSMDHPEEIFKNGAMEAAISSLCTLCKIPAEFVFPIINYKGAFNKHNYIVQLLIANILFNIYKLLLRIK